MIVGTDVFVMSVLHPKTIRYCSKLNKAQTLIQMTSVDITFDDSIELKDTKSDPFCG